MSARLIHEATLKLAVRTALVGNKCYSDELLADLLRIIWDTTIPAAPVGYVSQTEHLLLEAKYRTATNLLAMYGERDRGVTEKALS